MRILLASFKDSANEAAFDVASQNLLPSNMADAKIIIRRNDNLSVAIANPDTEAPYSLSGIVTGHFFGDAPEWYKVESPKPDGSYALCRWSDSAIELITDTTGSRSLWYINNNNLFAASNSIKALVSLIGDFDLNKKAISWFLATGSLGPHCWDRRIMRCPPDSTVTFNREARKVSVLKEDAIFSVEPVSLEMELEEHFKRLTFPKDSVVTLSGGVDSRAILAAIPPPRVPCITWGTRASAMDSQNDVVVAKTVADRLKVQHDFLEIDEKKVELGEILSKFIDASEGCTDHIGGYLDGCALWRKLYETGVRRIIRGDEGFGWNIAINEKQMRLELGLGLISDYFTKEQIQQFEFDEVDWPYYYHRHDKETLETWRDRLYHTYRIPVVMASLSELKAAYVEVINPLLSRNLILASRRLSDSERTGKRAFRRWSHSLGPKLPYARADGTAKAQDVLRTAEFANLVASELADADWLNDNFREHVVSRLRRAAAAKPHGVRLKAWARKALPASVKARLRAAKGDRTAPLDPAILALRTVIISRMIRILRAPTTCPQSSA